MGHSPCGGQRVLVGQLAQELLFIQSVLEGLSAINEHDGNLVGELAAQLVGGINIDFTPGESAATLQFAKALFHHLAQVASFARINDDFARAGHAMSLATMASTFLHNPVWP
jgi:hypothetical protein